MIQWWLVVLGLGNLWWLGDPLGNPSPYTGAPGIQWGSSPQQGPAMQKVQAFFAGKRQSGFNMFQHVSTINRDSIWINALGTSMGIQPSKRDLSITFIRGPSHLARPMPSPKSISKVHQSPLQLGVKNRIFSPDGSPKYIAGLCMVVPPYPNHMVSSFNGLVFTGKS